MQDIVLRILYEMNNLTPTMVFVAILTLIVFAILTTFSRNMWFNHKRFKIMSLFFGLSGYDCVRIACSWIKLCLILIFLALFKPLTVAHYFMFAVVGVLGALDFKHIASIPLNLITIVMEFFAILAANVVCMYIIDLQPGFVFNLAYVLMSIFIVLFGFYSFLTELNAISNGRRLNAKDKIKVEEYR